MQKVKCAAMLILTLLAMAGCAEPGAVPTIPPSTPTHAPSPTPSEAPVPGISAGIVEKLDLEDLAVGADCILVGTVEDIKSEWNRDRTVIYTYIKFSVENSIKGCLDQKEVTIRVPGGQVGDISMHVPTAPTFEAGEKTLVFLEVEDDGSLHVPGGFQGKFTIQDNVVLGPDVPLPDFVKEIQSILQETSLMPTPEKGRTEPLQEPGTQRLDRDVSGQGDN
jgi:hypothetical protein